MATFQDHFAENLAGFGWSVDPAGIPSSDEVSMQLHTISDWWHTLDQGTQDILQYVDLSDGLQKAGKLAHWPGYYDVLAGNPFEHFSSTNNNVIDCFVRARNAVGEDAAGETETEGAS